MVISVPDSARRIVVKTAGHGFGPLVCAGSAGERFGQADAVAVLFHQHDGDAERVGVVQLDGGEGEVDRGLDGRHQFAAGLRRGGRPPVRGHRCPALGAAGQQLLGVGELVQHVAGAGGEHQFRARRRADDGQLAGGGDVVRLPREDNLVRAGHRGNVRERIGVRIARKGVESSERLGRRRWVIERTISWLSGYRRLSPRYERNPRNYLAFLGLAAAICCYKRYVHLTT
ncbi:transposase [Streptomyces cellulosae]|uniref:Transposase n=1 Tax=Streptomyces cellulosae TaxID=1968 RepID=A0ABW7YIU8_STRCE